MSDDALVASPPPLPDTARQESGGLSICENDGAILYDVAIVGGGVVGLSILRHATLQGYRACVLERDAHLLSRASGHNSGIACTGVDAPLQSLERALIRESAASFRSHCRQLNVPARPCGSLVCAWPWNSPDSYGDDGEEKPSDKLERVWQESADAGDTHARLLAADEVQALEPHLHPNCLGAVHIPGEVVVDPWLYSVSLAAHARENGARIFTSFPVDLEMSRFDDAERTWTLVSQDGTPPCCSVRARAVVNATGVWADAVEQGLLQTKPSFESRPRRGQYRVFRPVPIAGGQHQKQIPDIVGTPLDGHTLNLPPLLLTHPIQPVPTQRTKGIFVFSSLYHHLIVGPTAHDQEDRQADEPCPVVRQELTETLHRILRLPSNEHRWRWEPVGEYVGIRPGTTCRDYQIHLEPDRCWVTCAGIRSTGLSASLGIGRHVVYLLQQGVLPVAKPLLTVQTTPLPPLAELIQDYWDRNDGSVRIGEHVYRVTHPITELGWRAARRPTKTTTNLEETGV